MQITLNSLCYISGKDIQRKLIARFKIKMKRNNHHYHIYVKIQSYLHKIHHSYYGMYAFFMCALYNLKVLLNSLGISAYKVKFVL